MQYKYGNLSSQQLRRQKKYFKNAIYQLLCFKEEGDVTTQQRFTSLLQELDGFNRLFQRDHNSVFTAMCLLEYARVECEHDMYRKAMLDAIGFIDMIKEDTYGND